MVLVKKIFQIPTEILKENSPEPHPHEAESLRNRLELEAKAEIEADKRQKVKNEIEKWIMEKKEELRLGENIPGDLKALDNQLNKCDRLEVFI